MTTNAVINPYQYFQDFNKGRPIFNGMIYVGKVGLDPEVTANQKDVTFLDACDCPVNTVIMQPIRTSSGGVPIYNGSPIRMFVEGSYSLKVNDSKGIQVYYSPDVNSGTPLTSDDGVETVNTVAIMRLNEPSLDGQQVSLLGHTNPGMGGGIFRYNSLDTTSVDNNGSVIVTVLGKRWIREDTEFVSLTDFGATGVDDVLSTKKAGIESIATGKLINVDLPVLDLTGRTLVTDMAVIGKGLYFSQPCKVKYDGFSIPVFFCDSQDSFDVYGAQSTYECHETKSAVDAATVTVTAILAEAGASIDYGTNANVFSKTVFNILGTDNVTIDNTLFKGLNSTINQYVHFVIMPTVGTRLTENVTITNYKPSDYVFGLNSSNFKNLIMRDISAGDYLAAVAPGHIFYLSGDNTALQQSKSVTLQNIFDAGSQKNDFVQTSEESIKISFCEDLTIENLVSYRQGGALMYSNCINANVDFVAYRLNSTLLKHSRYGFRAIDSGVTEDKNNSVVGSIYSNGQANDQIMEIGQTGGVALHNAHDNEIDIKVFNLDMNIASAVGITMSNQFKSRIAVEYISCTLVDGDTAMTLNTNCDELDIILKYPTDEVLRIATSTDSIGNVVQVNNTGTMLPKQELGFGEVLGKITPYSVNFDARISDGLAISPMVGLVDNNAIYEIVVVVQNDGKNQMSVTVLQGISQGSSPMSVINSFDDGLSPTDAVTGSFIDKAFTLNIDKAGGGTGAIRVSSTFRVIGLIGG